MMPPLFPEIVQRLVKHYRRPAPPNVTDPFQMILWENVAYLLDDAHRAKAFETLRKTAGLTPKRIAAASTEALVEATKIGGMMPDLRAERLRFCAETVLRDFDGDLNNALKLPLPEARKALKKFPTIGDPGAEKILLFTGTAPILALESNGLRVLVRLGYCEERKSYGATYRAAQASLGSQTGTDCGALILAYQILRRHGQDLCRRNKPLCHKCPLANDCDFGREAAFRHVPQRA